MSDEDPKAPEAAPPAAEAAPETPATEQAPTAEAQAAAPAPTAEAQAAAPAPAAEAPAAEATAPAAPDAATAEADKARAAKKQAKIGFYDNTDVEEIEKSLLTKGLDDRIADQLKNLGKSLRVTEDLMLSMVLRKEMRDAFFKNWKAEANGYFKIAILTKRRLKQVRENKAKKPA